MTRFRSFFANQRWLATWLIAATLAVRVLVPGGYMPSQPGSLTLMICSGHMPAATMAVPMPGMEHRDDGGQRHDRDKTDQACPFTGLAMPSIAGADQPVLLPSSPAPTTSPIGTLAAVRAPPRREHAQPPLRGPPSLG